ncbi:histidine kinase [Glycomyces sp. NPDC047010]|uniref:sensor histidine kinase n=1 Tax=Glycomyces sp. NPDC047010 TaxID=3155023 RepID=UPI0033FB6849
MNRVRRIGGGPAAIAAAAASLLGTALYRGTLTGAAGAWMLLEGAALAALIALAVRHAPAGRAWAAAVLGAAALAAQPLRMLNGAGASATEYVFFIAFGAVVGLAAAGTGLLVRLVARGRARALDDVRRRERLALAAGLHDLVAHDVTGIVLDAQATRAEGGGGDAALERIERAGLEALAAMDRTVGMLRGEGTGSPSARTYGVADLPELADRFAETARVPVRCDLDPDAAERVPRETGEAVYRLVAEALTNVRRHAPDAAGVAVSVTAGPAGLVARVSDTGALRSGRSLPRSGGRGGTGLIGLAARVEALGGEFRAGPDGAGWLVEATLPVTALVAE